MPLPKTPFTFHGGCACHAVRYTVSVPAYAARPKNPYRSANADTDINVDIGDLRIPMVTVDRHDDCGSATGALRLPAAVVTDIATVTVTCISRLRAGASDASVAIPAVQLFEALTVANRDGFLTCYGSLSGGRTRWFCGRCGTDLAYTSDAGGSGGGGGFEMLGLWLEAVDRADVEGVPLVPERELWWEAGAPWIREVAAGGEGMPGVPEHLTMEIDGRVGPRGVERMLAEARSHLLRVSAAEARREVRDAEPGRPVVLVDIRSQAQRAAEGGIEGAVVVERNVLEWRFDPCCDARLPVAGSYDLRVIVLCQEGYTSSLAARSLQEIGLVRATDVVGGYKAWRESSLPEKL